MSRYFGNRGVRTVLTLDDDEPDLNLVGDDTDITSADTTCRHILSSIQNLLNYRQRLNQAEQYFSMCDIPEPQEVADIIGVLNNMKGSLTTALANLKTLDKKRRKFK